MKYLRFFWAFVGTILLLPGLCSLALLPGIVQTFFHTVNEPASSVTGDPFGISTFSNVIWFSSLLIGFLGAFILWALLRIKKRQ